MYRHLNEKEDKNAAKNEQSTKYEDSLDTSLTKNESKFSDANSKTSSSSLQAQHASPYKFVEIKVGSNLISEFSAENSELKLAKSSWNNLQVVNLKRHNIWRGSCWLRALLVTTEKQILLLFRYNSMKEKKLERTNYKPTSLDLKFWTKQNRNRVLLN